MPVLGGKDLEKKLNSIGSNESAIAEAIDAAADVILAGAKERCQSSKVSQKIKKARSKTKRDIIVFNVSVRDERAAVEEFGSGPRQGLQGPHNFPARSYMRRTADEDWRKAGAVVEERLGGGGLLQTKRTAGPQGEVTND